jgi:galactokinase
MWKVKTGTMLDHARDLYRDRFSEEAEWVIFAPGRVNLLGEHTDYNGGFVFPAAIDKGIWLAGGRATGSSTVFSDQLGEGSSFDARSVLPGDVKDWSKFAAGMAWVLRDFIEAKVPNINAAITSNLPLGSGVSSSAAVEMAFGLAFLLAADAGMPSKGLAVLGQRCENLYVGVNCGIMDQMASACGVEGGAIFMDTRTLEIVPASIPSDLTIVLLDTKKSRELAGSAYNVRRAECEEACRILGVPQLRDATLEMVLSHKRAMLENVFKRAKHVVTENNRTLEFRTALNEGNREAIGALMHGSHQSLRLDYEVSSAELDAMAEIAWSTPGCVGARMTGAGFGGSCVALVEADKAQSFCDAVVPRYVEQTGLPGSALICKPSAGAHRL